MSESKFFSILIKIIYTLLTAAGLWLFFRFLLPWLLPFIIALLIARLMEPAVKALITKLRLPRFAASAICTLLVLGALFGLMGLISTRAVYELSALLKQIPAFLAELPDFSTSIQNTMDKLVAAAPYEMQEFLSASISKTISEGVSIPSGIYEKIMALISGAAGALPNIVLFMFALGLGIYFTSSEYPSVSAFIIRQLPMKWRSRVLESKNHLMATMGKWLKAQLVLMAITFVELSIGFSIMQIKFSILLAALVAVIDALPVFGTGTVLLPWAAWSLITRDYNTALTLVIIYGTVTLVHSFMEPKLIGKQLGLTPLVSLICIYLGYSAAGIPGMILAPITLMMIKQLSDWGYIKIFK